MSSKGRRNRGDREHFWRDLIQRQRHSGQSIRAFCDSQGVSAPSFFSWRKRLSQGRLRSQFVPVHIDVESASAPPGRIEIRLNEGTCVRVEPGFDEQALRCVLRVLEQPPC